MVLFKSMIALNIFSAVTTNTESSVFKSRDGMVKLYSALCGSIFPHTFQQSVIFCTGKNIRPSTWTRIFTTLDC